MHKFHGLKIMGENSSPGKTLRINGDLHTKANLQILKFHTFLWNPYIIWSIVGDTGTVVVTVYSMRVKKMER